MEDPRAGDEQHRRRREHQQARGPDIGLEDHEQHEDPGDEAQREEAVRERADALAFRGERGGEIEHERELRELRRLETE